MRDYLLLLSATLAMVLTYACTGEPAYTEEEVAEALAQLRPPADDVSWQDFTVSCLRDRGISVPIEVDHLGQLTFGKPLSVSDREQLIECEEERRRIYTNPTLKDPRLELTAIYQLQILAAACVEERLGLNAHLPTLDRYVDSGGDRNMYDHAFPADEAEWIRWNQICTQDLWRYYESTR